MKLPRLVMKSPSLEIFEKGMDVIPSSLLWLNLCLAGGVGLGVLQRSLPTSAIG